MRCADLEILIVLSPRCPAGLASRARMILLFLTALVAAKTAIKCGCWVGFLYFLYFCRSRLFVRGGEHIPPKLTCPVNSE